MILEHYARGSLALDQRGYEQRVHNKPRGFWVSVKGEDDWPSWCRSEKFAVGSLGVRHAVTLAEHANILHLGNVSDILDFHGEYSETVSYYLSHEQEHINWELVAEQYDGIIIAPYQWSLRLGDNAPWYYSWDVASGCIWSVEAISEVTAQ